MTEARLFNVYCDESCHLEHDAPRRSDERRVEVLPTRTVADQTDLQHASLLSDAHFRAQPMVGMTNSASARMRVGQRVVMVFTRV